MIYFFICVKLDARNTNYFKGEDKNTYKLKANVNRKKLDKSEKVNEHETFAKSVYDDGITDYNIKVNEIEKVYKDGV